MGVATFERIYHSMSAVTGVPFTNSAVTTVYQSIQQSMPSAPQINAFLPSHQTAFSQLAGVYCAQLVGTPSTFSTFFAGSGFASLNSNLTATAASYFGTTGAGNQTNINGVVQPLVNAIVGPTAYPQAAAGMTAELNLLLPRIGTLSSTETVSAATIAACTAALGSAAATVQ